MLRLFLLLAFAALVHAPSLGNGFALDDRYVAKAFYNPGEPNEMVATLQPVSEYFDSHYWRGVERSNPLYRPVTIYSYALVYHALGKRLDREAFPQHLLNLGLFVGSVGLLWLLLGRCGARGHAQSLGTAVFAAHALHAEAVSAVSGRAELLAFCGGAGFALLGAHGIASFGLRRAWSGSAWLLAAAVAFFVAIASKENALAFLPFAVVYWLVAEHVRTGGGYPARSIVRHGLWALGIGLGPIVAFAILREGALGKLEPGHHVPWVMNPLFAEPAGVRIPSAVMIWGYGLLATLLPIKLAADYGASVFTLASSWLDLRVLAAAVGLLALLALGIARARRAPLLLLAAAAFLGLGFLTTNIPLPIGTAFAERLYFSPSVGLAFAVAALLAGCPLPWQGVLRVAVFLWCAHSARLAFGRAFDWKDDTTLYTQDAKTQPRSMFLRLNASVIAAQAGDLEGRDRHLREAVAIEPHFARAWNDLGVAELTKKNLPAALECIQKGLASPRADPQKDVPMLRLNLALVHSARGSPELALPELEAVLRADPGRLLPRLGQLHTLLRGRVPSERLLGFLKLGAQLAPAPEWGLLAGIELVQAGRHAEGEAVLRAALPSPADAAIKAAAALCFAEALIGLRREGEAAPVLRQLIESEGVPEEVRDEARRMLGQRK